MENILLSVDRRGRSVLAKRTKWGVSAKTFANLTQAYAAAAKINMGSSGFKADVAAGPRPWLVLITAKLSDNEWFDALVKQPVSAEARAEGRIA